MQKNDLEKEFLRLNSRLARTYAQRLSEVVGGHDLSTGQFAIADLIAQKGALTPSALATLLEVETSTIAATLRRAEAAGIVRRVPDPKDGRGKRVELTDIGVTLVVKAQESVQRLNTDLAAKIGDHNLSSAKQALKRALNALET